MDKKIAIQAALTRQLFSASKFSQFSSILLAALLAFIQKDVVDPEAILAWGLMIVLAALFRTALIIAYQRSDASNNSEAHSWLVRFRFGVLVSGLAWGSASILLYPPNDLHHQIFLFSILATLMAGAVITLSADLVSAIIFGGSVMSPLIVYMMLAKEVVPIILAAFYFVFLIMSLRGINRNAAENVVLHLDAAEREKEVRLSEQRYRLLLNHSPAGILHFDSNLIITYCNDRLAAMLHNSAERIKGVDITRLKDQSMLPAMKEALEGKLGYYEGYYSATLTDVYRCTAITCAPSLDSEGKIVGGVAIIQDITERKLMEAELRASRNFLDSVIDSVSDPIFVKDRQHRWTLLNDAFCTLIGHPREVLIGKSDYDFFPREQADVFWEKDEFTFESNESSTNEESFTSANGEMRFIQTKKTPFVSGDGRPMLVGVIRDITASRQAEARIRELNAELGQRVLERTAQLEATNQELRDSEQRYREIFDNVVEGIYLLEVTGDGRFRHIDINPALAQATGIPREAIVGKYVDETVSEEVASELTRNYRHCVAEGKTIAEETVLDLPAGKRVFYSTITPIYYKDRIHRLICISRDITELKLAERDLEESRAQLRGLTAHRELAREEERKHIAREVHDELGQILTGLKLNISVLNHRLDAGQSLAQGKLKESMLLTDQALEVARNVASALRPAALEMGIVSALEWLASRFSSNTGIRCEVQIEEDNIQLDEAPAIALFRIVQESLTNVSRHAKAARVDVTLRREEGNYVMSVIDNGCGFDASRKKTDSFGLVGIRERALMLGGTVDIDSQPGEGTEIVVRIPVPTLQEES